MPTTVIHIKDAPAGWMRDPQYVYCGRGSIYGNRFKIGVPHPQTGRPMTRDDVCDLFEKDQLPRLIKRGELAYLRGRILVCFCHPKRCHGHSLAKAANDM